MGFENHVKEGEWVEEKDEREGTSAFVELQVVCYLSDRLVG